MKRKIAMFLCIVLCVTFAVVGTAAASARDISNEEIYATALKQLGLFRGVSDTDFDLDRAPTRVEALVMLIRALGKEDQALDGTWDHPFDDVPTWANPYVGYAYENGLTNGVSATKFGNTDATAATYLTFVLRALGYSDENGKDFTWKDPFSLAESVGILDDSVNVDNFWRADVATVSYLALSANLKGSADTLADKLIEADVFTIEQYGAARALKPSDDTPTVPDTPAVSGEKLSAEEISEKCAPAVFFVEVYGYNGKLTGTGSGFFISADGYAITNFHVAANSSFLVITTVDGEKYADVTIIDASKENDLALLKVDSEDAFPYLEIGDSDKIKQGQIVYAIGSPRGLENTLSQGLISSVQRVIDEQTFIQVSVQIDYGSSGGALINEYGEVIAVTAGGITESTADLNFAVPINKLKELDKNNTEEPLMWADKFYAGFEGVYDFGAFTGIDPTGVEITPLGFWVAYGLADTESSDEAPDPVAACLENYEKALISKGFTVTYLDEYTAYYESETVIVIVAVVIDEESDDTILVLTEFIPHFYEELPEIMDFGWYLGVEDFSYSFANGTHSYQYKWDDYCSSLELETNLLMYFFWLETEDYVVTDESDLENDSLKYSFNNGVYEIICVVDSEHVTFEISDADDIVVADEVGFDDLCEYIISNGTYIPQYDIYKVEVSVGNTYYDMTYFVKSSSVHFSSGTWENGNNKNTYIYLFENGRTSVVFMYDTPDQSISFKADFDGSSFSSGAQLAPYEYTGTSRDFRLFHDTTVSEMVKTLKGCETYLLKDAGITLADLGFTNLD